MRTRRRLLNGELLELTVPDATMLPASASVGVVRSGRTELELTSAEADSLAFFLESTGSALRSELALRSGERLRVGPFGGDSASGHAFSVTVGKDEVYGYGPPSLGVEDIAGWLSGMTFTATPEGAWASLGRGLAWSPTRTFAIAQQVDLSPSEAYLLDIRRVQGPEGPTRPEGIGGGVEVRGGRLSRSHGSDERRHVVLESAAFVTYAIPTPSTSLDRVVESVSQALTELR